MGKHRDIEPIRHDALLKALDYDPLTGEFVWKVALSNRAPAGSIAGQSRPGKYTDISIFGLKYRAHKLAVYWYSGIYPLDDVDHIDGDRSNNRILNLRCAGTYVNAQNRRGASKNSRSGVLGVCYDPRTNRYRSQILANGVRHHLGRFDTEQEAQVAYIAAKRKLHQGNTL